MSAVLLSPYHTLRLWRKFGRAIFSYAETLSFQGFVALINTCRPYPVPPVLPPELPVLPASHVGRGYTYIVRGSAREVTERLAGYRPLMMEALPLSLEEIFIYELGGEQYAVKEIVL